MTSRCGPPFPDLERHRARTLPVLLTVDDAADLLRTTRRAIYAMVNVASCPVSSASVDAFCCARMTCYTG